MSCLDQIGSSIICAAVHLASDALSGNKGEYEASLRHALNTYGIDGAEGKGAVDDIASRLLEFAKRIVETKRG